MLTERLRLEPVGPDKARDLWLVASDEAVAPWYDGSAPSLERAEESARQMGESWQLHGVHKWIAYDLLTGEVVGRGGLSRTPVDDDWGQLYAFLPDEPWVRAVHSSREPMVAHASWVELGWALRSSFWGAGYASELGRAGLAFAFGMRDAGEIRSRGIVEGKPGEQDDAPYAVCVILREAWQRAAAIRMGGTPCR